MVFQYLSEYCPASIPINVSTIFSGFLGEKSETQNNKYLNNKKVIYVQSRINYNVKA